MFSFFARAVIFLLLAGFSTLGFAQHPSLLRPFPYAADDEKVDLVLRDLIRKTGMPVIADDEIKGTISVNNADGRVTDVLDSIAEQLNAVWWFDGTAVRVQPNSVLTNRMITLNGIDVATLKQQLAIMKMENQRFPLIANTDASMVRAAGPADYVDAIEDLVNHLAMLRTVEQPSAVKFPLIIRGREHEN